MKYGLVEHPPWYKAPSTAELHNIFQNSFEWSLHKCHYKNSCWQSQGMLQITIRCLCFDNKKAEQNSTEQSSLTNQQQHILFSSISYLVIGSPPSRHPDIQSTLKVNKGFFWQLGPNFLYNQWGGRTAPALRTAHYAESRALKFCMSPGRAPTRVLYVWNTRTSGRLGHLWQRSAWARRSWKGRGWSDRRPWWHDTIVSIWGSVLGYLALLACGLPPWGSGCRFRGRAPAESFLGSSHPHSRRDNLECRKKNK